MTFKVDDKLLEELSHGLNSLVTLLGITSTVIKYEENGLDEYFNKEFEKIVDVEELVDNYGMEILDENGNPQYKEVLITTQEEQDRNKLKQIMTHLDSKSSQDLIDIFNKDTKSNVNNLDEMRKLIEDVKLSLSPVVQLGKVSESLERLGATSSTIEEIQNIYEREIEKLKSFLLL